MLVGHICHERMSRLVEAHIFPPLKNDFKNCVERIKENDQEKENWINLKLVILEIIHIYVDHFLLLL